MILSCVIIARDEEELLQGCIDSLPAAEEIVVVDTGSTDRTIDVAKNAGARIEHFTWVNDFAAARNFAESKCTGDYVYWQDADERLVAGAEIIRAIVDAGQYVAVRPLMVWQRDEYGRPSKSYPRQDLLHKRGAVIWKGARHEATILAAGTASREERGIEIEQVVRAGGDRAYGDPFEPLRPPADERGLFYLAREHSYAGHHHETIALANLLLESAVEWPIQRSHAAILKAEACKAMGRVVEAREAYLRAIDEWGAWAEPYFGIGVIHYELQQWSEGAAWFAAATMIDRPPGYFVDDAIYDWRRYDLLAVCLFRMGRLDEAKRYGAIALGARPDDARLRANMGYYSVTASTTAEVPR